MKVTNSQLDTTNESQEVSPFPAGDHYAHINRRIQMHSKRKTEKNIKDPQKKYRLGTVSITLCILLEFPMPIDTIGMTLPTVFFKGLHVEFYKLSYI